MIRPFSYALPLGAALLLAATAAPASDAPPLAESAESPLRIELNRMDPVEGACRIMMVAENQSPTDIDSLVIEAVLFDRDGQVALLTLLDLQSLSEGRMRVRSFDLAGLDCDALGRMLVNQVTCQPADAQVCTQEPVLSSRVDVELRL